MIDYLLHRLLLIAAIAAAPSAALAKTADFRCSLTRLETTNSGQFQVADKSRSILLSIDDAQKKILVRQNGISLLLEHVMITEIVISGYAADVSVGLQRSSGNVVLQTYGKGASKAEFGLCTANGR